MWDKYIIKYNYFAYMFASNDSGRDIMISDEEKDKIKKRDSGKS